MNWTDTFLSIRAAKTDFSETFRPRGSSSVTNNPLSSLPLPSNDLFQLFVTDEDPWGRNASLKSVFATRMLKKVSVN